MGELALIRQFFVLHFVLQLLHWSLSRNRVSRGGRKLVQRKDIGMTSVARADADRSCQAQASADTSRLSIQGPCEEIWRVGLDGSSDVRGAWLKSRSPDHRGRC